MLRNVWCVYRQEAYGDVLVSVRTAPPSVATQTIVRRWSHFHVQPWMVARGLVAAEAA